MPTASETVVSAIRDAFKTAEALDFDPDRVFDHAMTKIGDVVDREWAKATFDLLITRAEELDAADHDEDSIFFDGVAALLSLAMELEPLIPMDDRA